MKHIKRCVFAVKERKIKKGRYRVSYPDRIEIMGGDSGATTHHHYMALKR